MEESILEKTGKPLSYWVKIVEQSKIEKHKAIIEYLQKEHGFSYGFANFVSLKARKADAASNDGQELVSAQYVNGKEELLPVYKQLLVKIKAFGTDINIVPKKDSVSIIRKKQFALIKPATKTRIDLGLKLKGKATTDRLEDSGPFGSMCTHRVKIISVADIDNY